MDETIHMLQDLVVEMNSFGEEQMFIFSDPQEREELRQLWRGAAERSPTRFISLIGPDHKKTVTRWAAERVAVPVQDMIHVLKKLLTWLKKVKSHHSASLVAMGGPKKVKSH